MLIEILGMVSPAASNRAARLQRYTIELSEALGLAPHWEWGLAAFVSQIGYVALPKEMLFKVEACQTLNEEEKRLYESHPEVASRLLAAVPRLEDVAAIVAAQFGALNNSDLPDDLRQWDIRHAGQLLLRAAIEYDRLVSRGASRESAINTLRQSTLRFPSSVLKAFARLSASAKGTMIRQIRLTDLTVGMTLDEDLISPKGIRLVPAGTEVTTTLMIRLTSIADGVGVAEPFRVRVGN
jgi:response regulator RpfG family c-di-GMP phosphodiesterase